MWRDGSSCGSVVFFLLAYLYHGLKIGVDVVCRPVASIVSHEVMFTDSSFVVSSMSM
jgi:hypothetical protein